MINMRLIAQVQVLYKCKMCVFGYTAGVNLLPLDFFITLLSSYWYWSACL